MPSVSQQNRVSKIIQKQSSVVNGYYINNRTSQYSSKTRLNKTYKTTFSLLIKM